MPQVWGALNRTGWASVHSWCDLGSLLFPNLLSFPVSPCAVGSGVLDWRVWKGPPALVLAQGKPGHIRPSSCRAGWGRGGSTGPDPHSVASELWGRVQAAAEVWVGTVRGLLRPLHSPTAQPSCLLSPHCSRGCWIPQNSRRRKVRLGPGQVARPLGDVLGSSTVTCVLLLLDRARPGCASRARALLLHMDRGSKPGGLGVVPALNGAGGLVRGPDLTECPHSQASPCGSWCWSSLRTSWCESCCWLPWSPL